MDFNCLIIAVTRTSLAAIPGGHNFSPGCSRDIVCMNICNKIPLTLNYLPVSGIWQNFPVSGI